MKELGRLLQRAPNENVKEEATGALWNISSCDVSNRFNSLYNAFENFQELKEPLLNQVAEAVVNHAVIPASGLFTTATKMANGISGMGQEPTRGGSNVFRNGTGILR